MLLSPQPASHTPGEVLSAAQCAAWRSDGAILLSELLPPALADGIAEAAAVLTDPERGGPLRSPHTRRIALCSDAALEPRLLRAAAQLLGVEDDQLRLTQSVVNADFAGQSSGASDPKCICPDLRRSEPISLSIFVVASLSTAFAFLAAFSEGETALEGGGWGQSRGSLTHPPTLAARNVARDLPTHPLGDSVSINLKVPAAVA
eukprot:COSAG06_NODE_248_length_19147_cov_105.719656_5_plen_204_part_00